MLYSDLYSKLILLTKRNDITHAEIADCIGVKHGAMFARAKRNSKIKKEELEKIEQKFNVDVNSTITIDNSLKKSNEIFLDNQLKNFGLRLIKLQKVSNLSDKEFAKLLEIYTDEYCELKSGKKEPNYKILNLLKKNFKLSVDWLLFGE